MKIQHTPLKARRLQERFAQVALGDKIREGDLTDEQASALYDLFPRWRPNRDVAVDEVYGFSGTLYRVVQAHTTQADWTPPEVPALFVPYTPAGVIAEWVQPTGSQNAYDTGDQVTHNGSTWESLVDANVWEPGTDETLWSEVT